MAAMEWTKDAVRALIASYREHPKLWNVIQDIQRPKYSVHLHAGNILPAYKDRNLKEIAYAKINESLRNDFDNITVQQIKKTIHILRSHSSVLFQRQFC